MVVMDIILLLNVHQIHLQVTDASSGTTSGTVTCHPVRFGEGVWEECAEPGITTTFDNTTMPLKLTRVLPGTFAINGGSAQSYTNGAFQFGLSRVG